MRPTAALLDSAMPASRIAPWAALLLVAACAANAMGNHPEANHCSADTPHYSICTAGSHDLQGWVGKCHATKDAAQRDADDHARKAHGGVMQWTGVARTGGTSSYGENRGLPP